MRAELVERRAHARGLVLAGGDDHLDAGDLERVGRPGARRRARRRRSAAPRRRRARAGSPAAAAPRSRTRSRRGWRVTPSTRAVSCGSSASAVPIPTTTASRSARQWCGAPARVLARDPLRVAGAGGDLAVERHRGLEEHERAAGARVLAEGWLSSRARAASSPSATTHLDALVAQDPEAAAGGLLGRVVGGRPRRARCPASRIASVHGGVLPLVAARLERDVQRRAAQIDVAAGGDRGDARRARRRARRGSPRRARGRRGRPRRRPAGSGSSVPRPARRARSRGRAERGRSAGAWSRQQEDMTLASVSGPPGPETRPGSRRALMSAWEAADWTRTGA